MKKIIINGIEIEYEEDYIEDNLDLVNGEEDE